MQVLPEHSARAPDAEAAFGEKEMRPMATITISTTTTQSKTGTATLATKLIAGIQKHLAKTTSIVIAGSTYTPEQVTKQLQQIVDLRSDVTTATATRKAKLATEKTSLPALRSFMEACTSYVKGAYAGSPDILEDFGLQTKERTPLTAEEKTAAAAKRKATRAARHTMGSQQKVP